MKKQMTKLATAIAVISICLLSNGCASKKKAGFDGKVLRDAEGSFYKLEHRIGDCFFVKKIDVDSIKAFD